ncbi:MAG: HPr family phosphocarrier protein [Holophagales bacterium]|nr:MAG: HPr family phosphocarrier protein [Holophagales bacterium]
MIEKEIAVVNRLGLHARAAAKLVHLAGSFRSQVTLSRDGEQVDGKSILGILLLAVPQGTRLSLRCDGEDEGRAAEALEALFADRFGEGE